MRNPTAPTLNMRTLTLVNGQNRVDDIADGHGSVHVHLVLAADE